WLEVTAVVPVPLSAAKEPGTFSKRIGDQAFHFFNAPIIDQWSDRNAFFQTVSHLQFLHFLLEQGQKTIGGLALYEDTVRTNTCLAAVSEFARDHALHGLFHIGIAEDDVRCITAELERDLLHCS